MSRKKENQNLIDILYTAISVFVYFITFAGTIFKNKAIVLCYHGVKKEQLQSFERQVKLIKMINQKREKNSVRIIPTFDDGFFNLVDNALPILEANRVPSTIFAVTKNMGRPPEWNIDKNHPDFNERLMNESELKVIASDLVEIGSHTQNHSKLDAVGDDELDNEVLLSKKNLESILGNTVDKIALPHGAFNEKVINNIKEAGYKAVYTLEPRLNRLDSGFNVIGRFSVSPDTGYLKFYLICCGSFCWLNNFRKIIRIFRHKL